MKIFIDSFYTMSSTSTCSFHCHHHFLIPALLPQAWKPQQPPHWTSACNLCARQHVFHDKKVCLLSSPCLSWPKAVHYAYVGTCACSFTQLHSTLCNPVDCSPPDSSVNGIFQARILKCVAISYIRRSSQSRDRTHVSCTGRQFLYHCATWVALLTIIWVT